MAETDRSLAAATSQDQLAHGSLRIWDAIAISVSVLAPGMAMLLNTSAVAGVSGGSTPLAFLLGGVACLALAFVVIGFTRRMASAGYAYTYASRSLGKETAFVVGWLYFFGMVCFVPMTMSGVGYLAANLLGLNPDWWILFFFLGLALFVVLSVVKIKVTTRTQLIVGIVTVALIVLVDLITTAKGGAHGQAPSAFTFSHSLKGGFSGVFYGIIFGRSCSARRCTGRCTRRRPASSPGRRWWPGCGWSWASSSCCGCAPGARTPSPASARSWARRAAATRGCWTGSRVPRPYPGRRPARSSPATRSRGRAGLRWPSRPVMSSLATSALATASSVAWTTAA